MVAHPSTIPQRGPYHETSPALFKFKQSLLSADPWLTSHLGMARAGVALSLALQVLKFFELAILVWTQQKERSSERFPRLFSRSNIQI